MLRFFDFMKRIFLGILLLLLSVNFGYKAFRYLSYDKTTGKVVAFEFFTSKIVSRNRSGGENVSYESYKTPIVEAQIEGTTKRFTREDWDNRYLGLDTNDKVTVLIDKNSDELQLNSFFLFWVTERDFFSGLLILIFGTMLLGLVLPERKPKIRAWK